MLPPKTIGTSVEFYHGFQEDVLRKLKEKINAIPKKVLKLVEKYEKKYKGVTYQVDDYKKVQELCLKHGVGINESFDAVNLFQIC